MSQGPVPTGMAGAAANPATSPENLRQIAYHYPALRPVVAENPAAYEGLITWLKQFNDPEIDAAITRRAENAAKAAARAGAGTGAATGSPTPQAQVQMSQVPAPPHSQSQYPRTQPQYQPQTPAQQYPQVPAQRPGFPASTDPTLTPPLGVQTAPQAGGGSAVKVVIGILAVLAAALVTIAVLLFTGVLGGGGADPAPAPSTAAPAPAPSPSADAGADTEGELKFPAPSNAVSMQGFISPSGNVSCQMTDGQLRCSIYAQNYAAKGLQTCPDQVGFIIDETSARLDCSVKVEAAGPELAYGTVAANGDVACASASEGISCWNQRTGSAVAFAREGWRTGTDGRILPNEFRF